MEADAHPLCRVRSFSVADGLPGSIVTGLAQTRDNLMWLTTHNGLSCYDGYRFTTFDDVASAHAVLTSNHLTQVLSAPSGNIWTKTYIGDAVLFNTTTCQYLNVTRLIEQKTHRRFRLKKYFPLPNGRTWVLGQEHDYYRINDAALPTADAIEPYFVEGDMGEVYLDAAGREWIMSTTHTYMRQGRQLLTVAEKPYAFLCSQDGSTWVMSRDGIVAECRNGDSRLSAQSKADLALHVNAIRADGNHKIIIAADEGLYSYDTQSHASTRLSAYDSHEMYADSLGRLWCYGKDGITLYRKDGATYTTVRHFLPATTQRTPGMASYFDTPVFHVDSRKMVWVANGQIPFSYYDEASGQLVSTPQWGQARMKCAVSDRQGNLWAICSHTLAIMTFPNPTAMVTDLGTGRDTRAVTQCHSGYLLLGTFDEEVVRCTHEGQVIGYLSRSGQWQKERTTFAPHVYTIYEDRRQRLWLGTKGSGLFCLNKKGEVRHYMPDSSNPYAINCENIYDIREDSRGRIMIATFGGGLNIMEEGTDGQPPRFHHAGNDLKGFAGNTFYKIRRIEILPGGTVLLSTTGGLVTFRDRYDDFSKIRFYVTRHDGKPGTLLSNEVLQTCRTKDGDVYVISLGGGIQRIVDKGLLRDDLTMDYVYDRRHRPLSILYGYGSLQGLATDVQGYLWIIGEARVGCYKDGVLREYGCDALGVNSITEARPYSDGHRIVIATQGGATSFFANQMSDDSYEPNVVFTSIRSYGSDVCKPLLHTKRIEVDAKHRAFELQFAALDYRVVNSEEQSCIRYAYRMDDDEEWRTLQTGTHSISFNHFPAGHHVITVHSTNRNGVWLDNSVQLEIYAEPTFLESWWGRMIIVATLLVILITLHCLRIRRRNRETTRAVSDAADARTVRYVLRDKVLSDEERDFIDLLMTYIDRHLADDIKADAMAAAIGMTTEEMEQRLRQTADMTADSFVQQVRMQRAELMLKGSIMPYAEIAYATGFADVKHFNKSFRRRHGMSPAEYRKTYQG